MKTLGGIVFQVATVAVAFFVAASFHTEAANIIWTNAAGGGWNTAANWSPNQVPGVNDFAIITNSGAYTVNLDMSPTVSGFRLGASGGATTQAFSMNGLTFTLNGPGAVTAQGIFNFNGGTLICSNILTVDGVCNWSGGYVSGPSPLMIDPGAAMSLSSSAEKDVLTGIIVNAGTITWTGGALYLWNNGVITNLAGGLFDMQSDFALLPYGGGPDVFYNYGTFRKSAGNSSIVSTVFVNNGTIDSQTGAITINTYGSTDTFNSGSSFIGAGTIQLANSATVMNGTIYSSNLVIAGSTVTGTYTVTGLLTFNSGFLSGPGVATIATNATLLVNAPNYLEVVNSNVIVNAGTITWTSGSFWFGSSSVLTNLPGALFDAKLDGDLKVEYGGVNAIYNFGTFRKSVGSGSLNIAPTFINNGTLDAQTGTIVFNNNDAFNSGSSFIGAGTNLLGAGTTIMNGAIYSSNLVIAGSSVTGTYTVSGLLTFNSGFLIGPGVVTIATNGTLLVNAAAYLESVNGNVIVNAGTVTWTSGIFYLGSSSVLTNLPGALFDARLDNNIQVENGGINAIYNFGTFRKSAGSGSLNIAPNFINFGTSDAQTGTIVFNNNDTFNSGSTFIGAGANLLAATTNSMSGTIYSSNLVIAGSSVYGTYTVIGALTFNSGLLIGPGVVTIATNSTLLVNTPAYLEAVNSNVIVNAGTITWTSGRFYLGSSSVLTNLPGALFDAQFGGSVLVENGGVNAIYNFGTFRKSAGSTNLFVVPDFINGGTIDARIGVSQFSGSFTNPVGTLAVSGGSTIQILQPVVLPAGSLITGSGTVQAPSITSSAAISPGATNAVLNLAGNYTQLLGGSMQFDIGGTLPGVNQSQVNITGSASLGGLITLRLSPGYVPAVNSSNLVLTAGSRSGQFNFQDHFFLLGQNKRFVPVYGPTNLVLATTSAADPTNFSLSTAVLGQTFALAWPSEFGNYGLYVKTNLEDLNWTSVPGITNFYMETPVTSPHKFFRLF